MSPRYEYDSNRFLESPPRNEVDFLENRYPLEERSIHDDLYEAGNTNYSALDQQDIDYYAEPREDFHYHSDYKESSVRLDHSASYTARVPREYNADLPTQPSARIQKEQSKWQARQSKPIQFELEAVILIEAKYPFLNDVQIDLVCKKILQDIDEINIDTDSSDPQFKSVKKEGIHLKVNCANARTKLWLQRKIEKWPPLFDDKKSKLYVEDDPRLLRPNTRINVLIPAKNVNPKVLSIDQIIHRLKCENTDVQIKFWRYISHKVVTVMQSGKPVEYTRIIFDVPIPHLTILINNKMMVNFRQRLVEVKFNINENELIKTVQRIKLNKQIATGEIK